MTLKLMEAKETQFLATILQNLNTNNLKPGTYFLHINNGKEVLTKQIFVK